MEKAIFKPSNYPSCIGFYELDIMKGCDVDCIYCGLQRPGESELLDTTNVLNGPAPDRGIYMSPNTDAFHEKGKEAAHEILERFLPEGVPFLLIIKNPVPEKTIELLSKYRDQVVPQVSLARLDNYINRYIEPGAPSSGERLQNMKDMASAGLNVTALMMPAYPGIDDLPEKISGLMGAYADAGAHYVKAAYAVINRRELDKIQKMTESTEVPQLKDSWEAMTEEIKVQIGRGNVPPESRRKEFYRTINEACREYDLKFTACSVLDPPAHNFRSADIPVCKSVKTFNPDLKMR